MKKKIVLVALAVLLLAGVGGTAFAEGVRLEVPFWGAGTWNYKTESADNHGISIRYADISGRTLTVPYDAARSAGTVTFYIKVYYFDAAGNKKDVSWANTEYIINPRSRSTFRYTMPSDYAKADYVQVTWSKD